MPRATRFARACARGSPSAAGGDERGSVVAGRDTRAWPFRTSYMVTAGALLSLEAGELEDVGVPCCQAFRC